MFKLLKRYIKNYYVSIFFVFIFSALQVLCQLILPQVTEKILKNGVANGNLPYIYKMGAFMLAIVVGVGICMIISGYFSARVTARFTCDTRQDLFRTIRGFRAVDYNRFGEASLLTRSTADVTMMQIMMINSLRSALLVPFTGLGALIVAMNMNWTLTLVVLAAFLVTLVFVWVAIGKSRPRFEKLQDSVDRINLLTREKLAGTRHVRAFRREDYETKRVFEANDDSFESAVRANRSINFLTPAMQIVMNLTIVVVYYLSAVQIQHALMDTADLITFLQYILNFVASLTTISAIMRFIPKSTVSARRVMEVLEHPVDKSGEQGTEHFAGGDVDIRFDHVSFGYDGAKEMVIKDVSFDVKQGQTLAIVGSTGSGKTTLVSLLLRLYRPTEGCIRLSGQEACDIEVESYRNLFSYAPQKAMIFQKSVMENLRVANVNLSCEEAMDALAAAEAADVVAGLPDGIDTVMAQNGMNVSGGQRQRLSVARALGRKAQVYVFDDSFSALDMKTDALVRANMRQRLQGKTIIIVAQRIATIKDADKILVMDDGCLVAQGTHEELLASCRMYQEIYATQSYTATGVK